MPRASTKLRFYNGVRAVRYVLGCIRTPQISGCFFSHCVQQPFSLAVSLFPFSDCVLASAPNFEASRPGTTRTWWQRRVFSRSAKHKLQLRGGIDIQFKTMTISFTSLPTTETTADKVALNVEAGSGLQCHGGSIKHLNGLRALAFLGVLLFHFKAGVPGGFLGVDVFFVLSGYLMTRSIQGQIDRETFGFQAFFVRRFWRLYPALLTLTLTVLGCIYLVFSTDATLAACKSALASVLGISNLVFMLEDDYFGASATEKPLLHTWSLSVEWQ
jgi:Acyltransferase family